MWQSVRQEYPIDTGIIHPIYSIPLCKQMFAMHLKVFYIFFCIHLDFSDFT